MHFVPSFAFILHTLNFAEYSDVTVQRWFRLAAFTTAASIMTTMVSFGIQVPNFNENVIKADFYSRGGRFLVIGTVAVSGVLTNAILHSILYAKGRTTPSCQNQTYDSVDGSYSLGAFLVLGVFFIAVVAIGSLKHIFSFKLMKPMVFTLFPMGLIVLKPKLRRYAIQSLLKFVEYFTFLLSRNTKVHPDPNLVV